MNPNNFIKTLVSVFCLFGIFNAMAQEDPYSIEFVHFSTPNLGSRGYQTLNDVDTSACLGKYGGWLEQNVGATGFYHTREIDGNWYVVDPEGYIFYTVGITSVQKGGGLDLPGDLKEIGINTMGNWSDESIPDIPFCPRMGFISSYKNTTPELNDLFHDHTFPVFGEEFASFVDREAKDFVEPYLGNPWVYGYHTDNEINFHHVDINKYLALAPTDPNYIGAYEWMIERKGSIANITDDDISDFRGYVAETYMSTVNTALKKYDPDHMNIGSRVHSNAKFDEKIMAGIGHNVDIMSINYYGRWNVDDVHMDMWIDTGGAPFIISEFYAKSQESGHPNLSGAGWEVYTLADRVAYVENMALRLLSHRGSVGWTLFRYIEGDNINNGLLKEDYTFYEGMADAIQNISKDIYNLRRFLLDEELMENTCSGISEENEELVEEVVPAVTPPVDVTPSFIPDPSKTYYIDSPIHDLRIGATGNSEEPFTTTTTTTGADVEWQFTSNGDGSWYIDRADGGDLPRLRTDNSEFADLQNTASDGRWESFLFTEGAIDDTHFITAINGPEEFRRFQIDNEGILKLTPDSYDGTWESFVFTEVEEVETPIVEDGRETESSTVVHITKRNAPDFALDGNFGGENGQDLYLWSASENNVNQQWIEIDRGNGYYSYQKMGTDYCIDGGNGGESNQNVYLWDCGINNYNQHWEKVSTEDGAFKLVKRNASGFALDGDNGGANGQSVELYNSEVSSQNLEWVITPIDLSDKSLDFDTAEVIIYPNPVASIATIQGAANTTVRIYDMNGKVVLIKNIDSESETIDLSILSSGVYYTQVNGLLNRTVLKVIKE